MATNTAPWGQTPLTAEGLASLDHPLSLSDFNQDAGGYWRIVRGQKTYYPREWFDDTGTFTGTGTQAGDRAGQDKGFFKTGMHWNWQTGKWENPTNWANVIGLAAAGGVGGAFAAPIIAGALGGGGAAAGGGVGLGETGAVTGLGGSGFGTGAGLGYAAVAPSVGEVVGASGGIGTLSGTTPVLEGVAAGPGAITAPSVGEAVGGTGLVTGGETGYVGADILGTEAASTAPGLASYPTLAPLANAGPVAGGAASGAVPAGLAPTVGGASTATKILQGVTGTGGGAAGAYSWLGPVVNGALNTFNSQQQIAASADAAQKQLDATKYAADAQAKAAADSLAFQRQQADYNALVAESTRNANYEQWAAKQRQLGSVGDALGLPARAIPAYVPIPPSGLGAPSGVVAPGAAGVPAAPADPARVGVTDPGQGGNATATAPATPAGADAAWWNAQDPRGSVAKLFGGAAPTSQAILDRKAQIEAAGGQVSPANAEGVTSKIYLPGVGWTRVLDGGVAGGPGGGTGTGWTFVPQGANAGGGAPGATAPRMATGNTDALGAIQPYLLDPNNATGRLTLPRYQPLGAVGSYV